MKDNANLLKDKDGKPLLWDNYPDAVAGLTGFTENPNQWQLRTYEVPDGVQDK